MLISQAHAEVAAAPETTATTATTSTAPADAAAMPSTSSILIQNVGMIVLLVVMFYFLLIRPQQKRFKEHKEMIDALKVGDRVAIGGLIGTVANLPGKDEVIIDLGNGTKVTAIRAMIQTMSEKTTETKK